MAKNVSLESAFKEILERIEKLEERVGRAVPSITGAHLAVSDASQCCAVPAVPEPVFDEFIHPAREAAIVLVRDVWANKTNLHYYLMPGGSSADKGVVRDAFKAWKDVGIGLEFTEVDDVSESEIRVSFDHGKGSGSYVGRQALSLPQHEATMNFGWTLNSAGAHGFDTALHEIGHAMGFKHEHQNPNAGIEWNEEAVYRYFRATQNPPWSRDKTFRNVIKKLDPGTVDGSDWDPNSIMHYTFEPGLIQEPEQYGRQGLYPNPGLSDEDIAVAQKYFPADSLTRGLEPGKSRRLKLKATEQADFDFTVDETRDYTIQTFGVSDTVMVLFEERDGEDRFVAGDDDSGYASNAKIFTRLIKGRQYKLRVRLYYESNSGATSVMLW